MGQVMTGGGTGSVVDGGSPEPAGSTQESRMGPLDYLTSHDPPKVGSEVSG